MNNKRKVITATYRVIIPIIVVIAGGFLLVNSGCGTYPDHVTVASYSVYGGFPYYGPGWGYYDRPPYYHRPDRPERPERPERPDGKPPLRPIGPITPGKPDRPIHKPVYRPPSNIGRPRPIHTRPTPRPTPRRAPRGRRR